jgi:hypothetical protein
MTQADALEEIMRQSLMYQLEIVKDEDETNEVVEKHQLQYSDLHRQQMLLEEQTEKETKNYLDLLESKNDKNRKEIELAAEQRLKKVIAQKEKTTQSTDASVMKKPQSPSHADDTASQQNQSMSDDDDNDEIDDKPEVKPEIQAENEQKIAEPNNN